MADRLSIYGDGVFETLLVNHGEIPLWHRHYQRLVTAFGILAYPWPPFCSEADLLTKIHTAVGTKQGYHRVRLVAAVPLRTRYTPSDTAVQFTVEVFSFDPLSIPVFLPNIAVFRDVMLSCDRYAQLKSTSALRYVMAAQYVQQEQLDDCFLLNANGRIAEASSSNVFIIKDGQLITPPLSEGLVAGVMRAEILSRAEQWGIVCHEAPFTETNLQEADGIFLSNAVQGVRIHRNHPIAERIKKEVSQLLFAHLSDI